MILRFGFPIHIRIPSLRSYLLHRSHPQHEVASSVIRQLVMSSSYQLLDKVTLTFFDYLVFTVIPLYTLLFHSKPTRSAVSTPARLQIHLTDHLSLFASILPYPSQNDPSIYLPLQSTIHFLSPLHSPKRPYSNCSPLRSRPSVPIHHTLHLSSSALPLRPSMYSLSSSSPPEPFQLPRLTVTLVAPTSNSASSHRTDLNITPFLYFIHLPKTHPLFSCSLSIPLLLKSFTITLQLSPPPLHSSQPHCITITFTLPKTSTIIIDLVF